MIINVRIWKIWVSWSISELFSFTLWWTNILPWKMAIEIVDFPIKNGDFPWQNVSSPGRVYPIKSTFLMERSTIFHGKIHYFYGYFPLIHLKFSTGRSIHEDPGPGVPAAWEDRCPGRVPGAGRLSAERLDVRPTRAGPRGHGRCDMAGGSLGGYIMLWEKWGKVMGIYIIYVYIYI